MNRVILLNAKPIGLVTNPKLSDESLYFKIVTLHTEAGLMDMYITYRR
ncbi:hypothetical protein [Anabaena sp. UHCC 0204]|nr:hypothetical protein [Anabaena sp. UHCC 0204]